MAVGIGVTTAGTFAAVKATVQAVHGVDPEVPVIIGGQAANPATARVTGADAWAGDGRQAVEVVSDLAQARRLWLSTDSGEEGSPTASAG